MTPPTTSGIYYYLEDELGTSRVIADSTGSVCYDADFYPYGGEREVVDNCPQNYKFTGQERDSESNLDNFEARYYSWQMGRFMTPDWSKNPQGVPYADFEDPQTLNLYSYVRDNPTSRFDEDGHCFTFDCMALMQQETANNAKQEELAGNSNNQPAQQQKVPMSKSTYKTGTAAAVAGLDAIIGQSEKSGWEYAGRIVKLKNGRYAYTLPTTEESSTDSDSDGGMKQGTRIPAGTIDAGSYHTHPTSCAVCAHDEFGSADNAYGVRDQVPEYMESGATRSIYMLPVRPSILDPTPPIVIRYGPPQ